MLLQTNRNPSTYSFNEGCCILGKTGTYSCLYVELMCREGLMVYGTKFRLCARADIQEKRADIPNDVRVNWQMFLVVSKGADTYTVKRPKFGNGP